MSNTYILTEEDIKYFKEKASRHVARYEEDFIGMDYGNYDDCFDRGIRDGETIMAREILDKLDIEYETDDDE